jgi:hypothetical protein
MLATTANVQTSVNEIIRKRAENQAVLSVQGERMRARGQTQAQLAARARSDAEAAKRRKYAKNHRAALAAQNHPFAPKASGKAATQK